MKRNFPLLILALLVSCSRQIEVTKKTSHYVEVERVRTVKQGIVARFSARALKDGGNNYLIKTSLPEKVAKSLRLGTSLFVSLPLVNSSLQKGILKSISGNSANILLENQIHDLTDQELEVQIPINSAGLYEIPFSSVYSPMGKDVFVFTVESDLLVKNQVNVIQVVNNDKILVLSDGLDIRKKVVTRGLDNVVEGDKVLSEDLNEF